jgi:hypothetical protein
MVLASANHSNGASIQCSGASAGYLIYFFQLTQVRVNLKSAPLVGGRQTEEFRRHDLGACIEQRVIGIGLWAHFKDIQCCRADRRNYQDIFLLKHREVVSGSR